MLTAHTSSAQSGALIRSRGGVRTVLAAVAALVIGLASLLVGPANGAYAQPGTVTDVRFENEQFPNGSRQQVNVDWAVEGTAENPVTVGIDLPEGLQGYADRFDMTGADGEVAGECVVTATTIECTVDPAYVDSHPQNMEGSFYFWVDVRLDEDQTGEQQFVFGDATTTVTVDPAPDNTCTEDCEYTGQGSWKSGWVNNLDQDELAWQVGVPAPEDGIPAGSTVRVTDHLDTEVYELVSGPIVREARSLRLDDNGRWGPAWQTRTEGLTISDDQLTVEFEAAPGFSGAEVPEGHQEISGSIYLVEWRVHVKDGIQNGVEYTNKAEWSVEGRGEGSNEGRVVRQGGGGSVVGENEGKFTLTKELAGDTTLEPGFTVEYTVDGEPQDDITIAPGETFTSENLPQGSTVVLEEVRPTEPANVTWADPVFVLPDGTESDRLELTFSRENGNLGKITEIRLQNEATLKTGSIPAVKEIVNDGDVVLPDDLVFTLDYEWDADGSKGIPEGSGSVELPADGTRVEVGDLPIGAEVSFSERTPEDVDGGTWEAPVITPDTVVVGEDVGVEVTVTNTLTATVGDFSIRKLVEGSGAELLPEDAEFTVEYEYPAGPGFVAGEGELIVPGDGRAATSGPLPTGAEVSLSEVEPAEVEGATWAGAEFSTDTVVVGDGTTVEVTLTNTLTENPSDPGGSDDPGDSDEPGKDGKTDGPAKPEGGLAETGDPGIAAGVIAGALVLLLVGGAALTAARLRRKV